MVRKSWTEAEQAAVRSSLAKYFFLKDRLPGKRDIEQCLKDHPCLASRTWTNVKDYIRNYQRSH